MIQKILILSFISSILVLADDANGRQCEADNYECRCYRLMKPKKPSGEIKADKKAIMERCAAQFNVTLPTKEAQGGNKHKTFENLPDAMKNCVATSFLTKMGQMDAQGKIVVTNATAIVTESVNANKGADVADTQVASIIAAVPGCAAYAATQQFTGHTYFMCMKGNCTLALQKTG